MFVITGHWMLVQWLTHTLGWHFWLKCHICYSIICILLNTASLWPMNFTCDQNGFRNNVQLQFCCIPNPNGVFKNYNLFFSLVFKGIFSVFITLAVLTILFSFCSFNYFLLQSIVVPWSSEGEKNLQRTPMKLTFLGHPLIDGCAWILMFGVG